MRLISSDLHTSPQGRVFNLPNTAPALETQRVTASQLDPCPCVSPAVIDLRHTAPRSSSWGSPYHGQTRTATIAAVQLDRLPRWPLIPAARRARMTAHRRLFSALFSVPASVGLFLSCPTSPTSPTPLSAPSLQGERHRACLSPLSDTNMSVAGDTLPDIVRIVNDGVPPRPVWKVNSRTPVAACDWRKSL